MKRGLSPGFAQQGPVSKPRHSQWSGEGATQFSFGMKILVAAKEASVVLGPGGATSRDISQNTGTKFHLSGRYDLYPGTNLQELRITGNEVEQVAVALLQVCGRIYEEGGRITGGDEDVEEGLCRIRLVVPVRAARAVIGKGGDNIRMLRQNSGLKVHVEEVPVGDGETAEQIIKLYGPFESLEVGVPNIVEHASEFQSAPWFSQWLSISNAGPAHGVPMQPSSGKGGKDGKHAAGGKGGACNFKGGGASGKSAHSASIFPIGASSALSPSKGTTKGQVIPPLRAALDKTPKFDNWNKSATEWDQEASFDNGAWAQNGELYDQPGNGQYDPSFAAMDAGSSERDSRNVEGAIEMVTGAVSTLPPHLTDPSNNRHSISLTCPSTCVSAVIGKGGAITKEITAATGAKIMIREIENNPQEKSITLVGNPVGVATAYLYIMTRISAVKDGSQDGVNDLQDWAGNGNQETGFDGGFDGGSGFGTDPLSEFLASTGHA